MGLLSMDKPRAIVVPRGIYEFNRVTDPKDCVMGTYVLNTVRIVRGKDGNATAEATDGRAMIAAWWNEHGKEDNKGYIDSTPPVVDEKYFPKFSKQWPETEYTTSLRVDARKLISLLEAMAAVCTDANGKAPVVLTLGLATERDKLLLTAKYNECKVAGVLVGTGREDDICHPKTPLFDPRKMET